MSVLQILYYPDDRLRKIAFPVTNITTEIHCIVNDMFETMYNKNGIGLAATQVNIHQRIIVIDISKNREEKLVLINPELQQKKGETSIEEGCLSLPEQREFVPRAEWITISAKDINGKNFKLETNGLLAICIQHEIDHLNGKLFIDHLSPLKRKRILSKLKKLSRYNMIR